jgi:hypothetical protein
MALVDEAPALPHPLAAVLFKLFPETETPTTLFQATDSVTGDTRREKPVSPNGETSGSNDL